MIAISYVSVEKEWKDNIHPIKDSLTSLQRSSEQSFTKMKKGESFLSKMYCYGTNEIGHAHSNKSWVRKASSVEHWGQTQQINKAPLSHAAIQTLFLSSSNPWGPFLFSGSLLIGLCLSSNEKGTYTQCCSFLCPVDVLVGDNGAGLLKEKREPVSKETRPGHQAARESQSPERLQGASDTVGYARVHRTRHIS